MIAGLLIAVAVWLWLLHRPVPAHRRLSVIGTYTNMAERCDAAQRGIAQVLASAVTRLKAGGSLAQAFGLPDDGTEPSAALVAWVLKSSKLPSESEIHVRQVSRAVAAACMLSRELGCRVVPCIEAVASAYRRTRLAEDLRARAYAMPKATIRLLRVLPLITVMFGEGMGASPLAFLFGSSRGWVCLGLASACYIAGMLWVRGLMTNAEGTR